MKFHFFKYSKLCAEPTAPTHPRTYIKLKRNPALLPECPAFWAHYKEIKILPSLHEQY